MNQFIEYVCRGVIRSEEAVNRLNRNVVKLAKCNRITNVRITCVTIAGILITTVIVMQDREIKALRRQVDDLTKAMEEQDEQEGA